MLPALPCSIIRGLQFDHRNLSGVIMILGTDIYVYIGKFLVKCYIFMHR